MRVDAAGSLSGAANLTSTLTDNDIVHATGGTLRLNGKLSGTGTLSAGAGATLAIGKASSFGGAITGPARSRSVRPPR